MLIAIADGSECVSGCAQAICRKFEENGLPLPLERVNNEVHLHHNPPLRTSHFTRLKSAKSNAGLMRLNIVPHGVSCRQVYRLGTRLLPLKVLNERLVVRVGGGYCDLIEFLENAKI